MLDATRTSWTSTAAFPTRNAPFAAIQPEWPMPDPLPWQGQLLAVGGLALLVWFALPKKRGSLGHSWP